MQNLLPELTTIPRLVADTLRLVTANVSKANSALTSLVDTSLCHRLRRGILFTTLLLFFAVGRSSDAATASALSDQELLKYASTPYDKEPVNQSHVVLGSHKGNTVVVDFVCSDICPQNTVRIIHYALANQQTCKAIGGVEKALLVPVAITMMEKTFCFPKVLVDHWENYQK